jgi:hypothetical protein
VLQHQDDGHSVDRLGGERYGGDVGQVHLPELCRSAEELGGDVDADGTGAGPSQGGHQPSLSAPEVEVGEAGLGSEEVEGERQDLFRVGGITGELVEPPGPERGPAGVAQ